MFPKSKILGNLMLSLQGPSLLSLPSYPLCQYNPLTKLSYFLFEKTGSNTTCYLFDSSKLTTTLNSSVYHYVILLKY